MDGANQGFWSNALGALGNAGTALKEQPEKYAIMLDMLGQGFDPKNPFAGIGTAMGKSSLAAKAEATGKTGSEDMFQRLLGSMTAKDQPGPTSMTAFLSPAGKGMEYSVKGLADLGDEKESRRLPKIEAPKILTDEDFMTKFGGGF